LQRNWQIDIFLTLLDDSAIIKNLINHPATFARKSVIRREDLVHCVFCRITQFECRDNRLTQPRFCIVVRWD